MDSLQQLEDDLINNALGFAMRKFSGSIIEVRPKAKGVVEVPDVIVFSESYSIIFKVLTNPLQIAVEEYKDYRKYPYQGLGDFRLYVCRKKIAHELKLPKGWGLITIDENGKRKLEVNPFNNVGLGVRRMESKNKQRKNTFAEYRILTALLKAHNFNKNV